MDCSPKRSSTSKKRKKMEKYPFNFKYKRRKKLLSTNIHKINLIKDTIMIKGTIYKTLTSKL